MNDKRFQKKLKRIKERGERMKQEKELRDTYAQYYPEKKEKKVSNVMLTIIVIAIVGYAIANFVLQYQMGMEISSTLTTCWFSFWGVEIAALTSIKLIKTKSGYGTSADETAFEDDEQEQEYDYSNDNDA